MSMIIDDKPAPRSDVMKIIQKMSYEDFEVFAYVLENFRSCGQESRRKINARILLAAVKDCEKTK